MFSLSISMIAHHRSSLLYHISILFFFTSSFSPSYTGHSTDGMFFSGGSDSKLLVWHDATQSEETKRLDEAEQSLLADQQLQNDIRNKRYDKVSYIPPTHHISHNHRCELCENGSVFPILWWIKSPTQSHTPFPL